MDRASAAQRGAAAELGTGKPNDVPNHPQQRCVGIDVDFVSFTIHVERNHHSSYFGPTAPAFSSSGVVLCVDERLFKMIGSPVGRMSADRSFVTVVAI